MRKYRGIFEWKSGKKEVIYFTSFKEYFKFIKKFAGQIVKASCENLDGIILYR